MNQADIHKAIKTAWDASGLPAAFEALWGAGVTASEHDSLRDSQAPPGEPLPYSVLELTVGATTDRMTGPGATLREIRDQEVVFSVNARSVSGDARTPKNIAAYLAEEIEKVFGGHPTTAPTALSLDAGNFLLAEYQNDVGVRTGDDEYQWRVTYLFRVDVGVAIA